MESMLQAAHRLGCDPAALEVLANEPSMAKWWQPPSPSIMDFFSESRGGLNGESYQSKPGRAKLAELNPLNGLRVGQWDLLNRLELHSWREYPVWDWLARVYDVRRVVVVGVDHGYAAAVLARHGVSQMVLMDDGRVWEPNAPVDDQRQTLQHARWNVLQNARWNVRDVSTQPLRTVNSVKPDEVCSIVKQYEPDLMVVNWPSKDADEVEALVRVAAWGSRGPVVVPWTLTRESVAEAVRRVVLNQDRGWHLLPTYTGWAILNPGGWTEGDADPE